MDGRASASFPALCAVGVNKGCVDKGQWGFATVWVWGCLQGSMAFARPNHRESPLPPFRRSPEQCPAHTWGSGALRKRMQDTWVRGGCCGPGLVDFRCLIRAPRSIFSITAQARISGGRWRHARPPQAPGGLLASSTSPTRTQAPPTPTTRRMAKGGPQLVYYDDDEYDLPPARTVVKVRR